MVTDLMSFPVCLRFTFCAQDPEKTEISPGESLMFLKCRDGWEVKTRKRYEMNDGFSTNMMASPPGCDNESSAF